MGYVIDRLIHTKAIFRKVMIKDSAGNTIIKNGKGNSKNEVTIYEVNDEILRRCRAIEEEKANLRTVKTLFGQGGKKKTKQNSKQKPSVSVADNRTAPSHWTFAEQAKRDNAEKRLNKVLAELTNDETVMNLRAEYKNIFGLWLSAMLGHREQEIAKLEERLGVLQEELREYLIKCGAPPNISEDKIREYIKE